MKRSEVVEVIFKTFQNINISVYIDKNKLDRAVSDLILSNIEKAVILPKWEPEDD